MWLSLVVVAVELVVASPLMLARELLWLIAPEQDMFVWLSTLVMVRSSYPNAAAKTSPANLVEGHIKLYTFKLKIWFSYTLSVYIWRLTD